MTQRARIDDGNVDSGRFVAQRIQAMPHPLALIVGITVPRNDFVGKSFAAATDQVTVGCRTDADARRGTHDFRLSF